MNPSLILLKLRAFFWLWKALIKRYRLALFLGFSVGLFLFLTMVFIYPFLSSKISQVKVKKIGLVGEWTSTNFPLEIQNLVSYGLTRLTDSREATAAAATRWEVEEEGKVYKFYLKPNLFWQDGEPFKAGDVNYNLKDAELSALDDFTLKIKLQEPFSPLPVLLSQPLFKKSLVGLGSYKVDSLETGVKYLTSLTLEPVNGKGKLPVLEYHFYPAEEKAVLAYKLGEIDVIEGLASPVAFDQWPVKVEEKTAKDFYVAVFYNTEDKLLSEKNIRQALTYGLPKFPQWKQAFSPLSPDSWAYNENIKKYEFDPEIAKKLLKTGKENEKTDKQKVTLSTTPAYHDAAEQIRRAWETLDLEVEVKIENEVPKNFQVLLAAQEIPPDPDQYSLWHSVHKDGNITHYKNPRIDKLLEDGRKITEQDERRKKYFDFQKYLIEDAPAAFLYYPVYYDISRH